MNVAQVEPIVVNVPYSHREVSSIVARDGVTDILVRITTDDGLVGWGEATSGADAASVEAAVTAMAPIVVGRDPWNREAMRADAFAFGLWKFAAGTGNFAWAGIDMALADICGKAVGQPLWRLLGGALRNDVTYFFYLSRGDDDDLRAQVHAGLAAGYEVFYLKVGLDDRDDERMVATVRAALGETPLLRIDVNSSWSVPQAVRMLERLAQYDIDFVEQPVRETPRGMLGELRRRSPVRRVRQRGPLVGGRRVRAHPRARGRRVLLLAVLGRLARGVLAARATSPSSRGCRSASTPTASSGSPRPPASTSC